MLDSWLRFERSGMTSIFWSSKMIVFGKSQMRLFIFEARVDEWRLPLPPHWPGTAKQQKLNSSKLFQLTMLSGSSQTTLSRRSNLSAACTRTTFGMRLTTRQRWRLSNSSKSTSVDWGDISTLNSRRWLKWLTGCLRRCRRWRSCERRAGCITMYRYVSALFRDRAADRCLSRARTARTRAMFVQGTVRC